MKVTGLSEFLDIESFVYQYPQFNENQLRWLVVKKHVNGLRPAIKKVGRRLYFHVPSFLDWMESQDA
jgi:hypothetical protein